MTDIHKGGGRKNIWKSPAASVIWRNMSQEEKQSYKILAYPEDSISLAVKRFIGIDEHVLMFGDPSTTSVEEVLRNFNVMLFNENDGELAEVIKKHAYCQVMMLTEFPNKRALETISSSFQGDKVICTCTPCKLSQTFPNFFPGFQEVATGCNFQEKFFIRTFVDQIGSPHAAQWFINTLNSEERKEYSVTTLAELEHYENSNPKSNEEEEEEKIWKLIDCIKNSPIEGRVIVDPDYLENFRKYIIYKRLVDKIGYHIPKKIEIEAVMRFIGGADHVVSVFSGKAFIENLLRMRNVNVTATDNYSGMKKGGEWMEVKQIDAIEAVRLYCNDDKQVLLMSWPEMKKNNNDHSDAFHVLKEFKGQKFIYFGEGQEDCCACYNFFKLLKEEFYYVKPTWYYGDDDFNHSALYFYIRL